MNRVIAIVAISMLLAACGQTPTPPPVTASPEPAAAPEQPAAEAPAEAPVAEAPAAAKHPWANFNAGSWVKLKSVTSMEVAGNKTETTTEMKYTLVEITDDKAIVELETSMAGLPTPTKTTMEIPLGVAASAMPTEAADAPKAVEGEEELSIAGSTLKCKTAEIVMEANGAKTTTKTWMSEDVPGWAVKTVSNVEGPTPTQTTMELVEFQAM